MLTEQYDLVVLMFIGFEKADGTMKMHIYAQPLAPQRLSEGALWRRHWIEVLSLLHNGWLPAGCVLANKSALQIQTGMFSPFQDDEDVRALVIEAGNKFLNSVGAGQGLSPFEWVSKKARVLKPWEGHA
ncbi:MAG: hypothetical protein WBE76_00325 [Terracidiphilus sp.]